MVNGGKEAVDTLLTDPHIKAEYTDTTVTAMGNRIQALVGAGNYTIVKPDADIDNAVSA